ncbi:family 2A encapsulin nanocompartment cargo protein cysteine desulfurase [Mucilaginibacter sp. BT774]|uniref:family 2A encapsulin nanocompartment cargo protein cysteine desulfurase n=1 Tax=Mucilaginibacter sp. BT774 TaxID=3062276 RepID=UPI00267720C7|nr:family 2A encapsulin nanocompartment cargo protein cysteine desulfurase [Mucilaginibacter sp. BT774]MDO3626778.1 family 2A encapsulin nanocompartment cargo protein cysteine desulfurase [Mucilaginibacter sp. BT774]
MSTNNYPEGLPDIAELEKLANQFFSALPGATAPVPPELSSQQHPGDWQGISPLGLENIPASASHSNFPPSAINVVSGVVSPHAHPVVPSPQSVGFSKVPPSVGGLGISPSGYAGSDAIDLRGIQSGLSNSGNIGFSTPASVAGSGISPSAANQGNAVDIKNPQTSLPDQNNLGLGHIPASVAGAGKSPSAIDKGGTAKIEEQKPNLPGSQTTGLGNIPQSVAGSGISPSAIEHNNVVDLQNPQTSFPDPHRALKTDTKTNNGYSTYLESINDHPVFTGNLPLSPEAPAYLPYQSEQPFEDELNELLRNIPSVPFTAQLPWRNPTGIAFYFFNEKSHLQHFANSATAQQELKNDEGHSFDVNRIKQDFPILQEQVNGKPLIWLDNAATTQKPKQVIDRISYFYEHENSNVHRAAHELAARSTDAYEDARKKVQQFLNAGSPNEIVFVRGTTEAINLVAKSWGEQNLNAGDEIILSHLEHHANIVPWQQLAAKKGLKIRVIPVDDDGQVILDEYAKLLTAKTRLVSFSQVSNALGTITPAKQIIDMAHNAGAKVLVDGAQSVSHMRTDVQALNADWFAFSGHKIFGPTGIGVLYGKEDLLNETQPWQGGGNMIKDVTFDYTQYHNAPLRFEAGTGNIADAVGLGAAIDYVTKLGIDLISQYEHYLLLYATGLLKQVPGLRLIGTAPEKASVLSFVLDGYTTEQVGSALNQEGIAVRSGHHCAQPILRRFGLESTVRPSLAFYNTCADIDVLVATLYRLVSNRSRK